MKRHGLSKSRFIVGWQCHRQLWWLVYEPEAPELVPDASLQAVFDRGTAVGEAARDFVPGGVLIDIPHDQYDRRLKDTANALKAGASAIYEASFMENSVFVAVDILEKTRGGWNLIEVKSTTTDKPEHLPDISVQLHVLQKAGLRIKKAELMHLNRECRYPDLSNLFARADLSDQAQNLLPQVRKEIAAQLRVLRGALPAVTPGPFCTDPHECPFLDRCWPQLPMHHISSLYRIGQKSVDLEEQGFATIMDLPADYPLSAIAERQRMAVNEDRVIVKPGLRKVLARWKTPMAFLDFETIQPAIPLWDGCRPYDQIPVQFSCHVLNGRGKLDHYEWIADGPGDPRKELVERVADAVKGAKVILAYNAPFEKRCLDGIKDCLPCLARKIDDITARIDDLLPVVRDHVYHPKFGGSFSLKSVLPALVPGMDYDGLEIADGGTASSQLEAMLLHGDALPRKEKARVREALLRYCEMDTMAMVKLLSQLRELS
jgi:hypothetical protein